MIIPMRRLCGAAKRLWDREYPLGTVLDIVYSIIDLELQHEEVSARVVTPLLLFFFLKKKGRSWIHDLRKAMLH